jgi:hypothetical protein
MFLIIIKSNKSFSNTCNMNVSPASYINYVVHLDSSENSPPVVQTTSPSEISWKQDLSKILGTDMLTDLENVSTINHIILYPNSGRTTGGLRWA